jgi:IS5 family transposase
MSRFRQRLKKKKVYALLRATIKSGFKTKVIRPKSIETAVIDSTVQEKNIVYPTDAKLYYKRILLLGKLARQLGIKLRQSYKRAGKRFLIKYGRYHHAKQHHRMGRNFLKGHHGDLANTLLSVWLQAQKDLQHLQESIQEDAFLVVSSVFY